jgi:Negative regulator of sigma F
MSDEEIRRLLAEGTEFGGAPLGPPEDRPDEKRLEDIRGLLAARLSPVRPLPSNPVLIAIALASFALICWLGTLYGGHKSLHVLSRLQMATYFGAFLLLAILFSIAIVEQMIPGSVRRVKPGPLITGAVLFLVALAPVLFENFTLGGFVKHGVPCLEFGTICAAVGGILGFFLIRKGFLASPLEAAVLTGCFAGLSGVTALGFVCPFLNAPHILVWHFGTMAIGTAAGALIGIVLQWRASQNEN